MRSKADALESDELKDALGEALGGRPARLEGLLSRYGAALRTPPNFKLAAALAAELAEHPGPVTRLLGRFAADDAAPDDPRCFLPIAAAHGWAARLRAHRDVEAAWSALGALAADERAPVRLGAMDALLTIAAREGGADALVERAGAWLDDEDRELKYGGAALVIELLADKHVLAVVRDEEALLGYVARVLEELADAPRSAERSDGRRRALAALPKTLAALIAAASGDGRVEWLSGVCERTDHPMVRQALSDALVRLVSGPQAQGAGVTGRLRAALQGSSQPPRDPTRVRPGQGRGKATRRVR